MDGRTYPRGIVNLSNCCFLGQETEIVEDQIHKRLESACRVKEIYVSYPGFVGGMSSIPTVYFCQENVSR